MIVKMKKFTIIAQSAKLARTTDALRELGLIHPRISRYSNQKLDELREELSKAQRALVLVTQTKKGKLKGKKAPVQADIDGAEAVSKITGLAIATNEAQTELAKLGKERELLAPWGEFDPALVEALRERGLDLEFAAVSKDQLQKLRDGEERFIVLSRSSKRVLVVAVDGALSTLGFETLKLSGRSLSAVDASIAELRKSLKESAAQLEEYAAYISAVSSRVAKLQASIEYELVNENFEVEGELSVLEGFAPVKDAAKVQDYCASAGLGVITADPDDEDQVPTVLKNPRPIRIIEPVLAMLGTYPGYKERDISFWFLMFFMVYFAMIIGDAGYGSFFFILSIYLIVRAKATKGRVPDILFLLLVLGSTTVIWGAITGNWFGYEPIARLPFFSQFVIPELDAWDPRSVAWVQLICFVLGTVQLTLGRFIQFLAKIRRPPRIDAFGELGWLALILGLYYLVLNLVIGAPYIVPEFAVYLIGAGLGIVFIFGSQQSDGFFKGILRSFTNIIQLALSGVGAFADVISYIRLFAVGLAGIEIAKSFNGMGVGAMEGGGELGIILGSLILLAGHTLNIGMAILSVVVHGVRLNMLEFSNHVGLEWAGQAYKPFSANNTKQ